MHSPNSPIDVSEIARGRRITAVAATELELTPRRGARPPRPPLLRRITTRLQDLCLRTLRSI